MFGPSEAATTITYQAGAGMGADVVAQLVNNDGVTLPDAEDLGFTAPEGHIFAGWKAADGRDFAAGQQVVVDNLNEGAENVLIAQWAPRADLSYTVNYVWVGSTDKIAASKTVTGVTYGATPVEGPIEVEGYTPVDPEPGVFYVMDDGVAVDIPYYKNVELTANSDSFAYDGTEQSVYGFTWEDDGARFDVSGIVAQASATEVGSYPVAFAEDPVGTVDGSERYIVTDAHPGTLTVTPRSVVFVGETKTVEYTGTEQEITGIEVAGTDIADGQTYQLAYSAKGTLPNTAEGYAGAFDGAATIWAGDADVTANYAIELQPGTLYITTSDIADRVTITPEHVEKKYDGAAYLAGTATATDENGNTVVVEYSLDGQDWTEDPADITATNVSDSTVVKIRASVPGYYEGYVYGEELLTITPRSVSLTSASDEKVYDGFPLMNYDITVAGDSWAEGEGASYEVTGSQTEVGSSSNEFAYTLNQNTDENNYSIETSFGTLEVTPASMGDFIELTTADVEKVYDGMPLAAGEAHIAAKHAGELEPAIPYAADDDEPAVDGGEGDGGEYVPLPEGFLDQFAIECSADGTTWTSDFAGITATNVADTMSATLGNPVQVRVVATSGNFSDSLAGTEDVVVTPRPIEVTAGSASKTYDAVPLTTDEWSITAGNFVDLSAATGEGAGTDADADATAGAPEGFSSVAIEGSQTLVGSSASTVGSYEFNENTLPGNYLVTLLPGTLTVTDGTGEGEDPVDPGKVIVKTHEGGTYKLGDVVEFAITATNIYDAPKTMTIVEQDGVEITGQSVFENVEPGEVMTTTARYTVCEADILAGGFTNIATVEFADGPSFPGKDDVDVEESNAHLTVSKSTTSEPAEGEVYKLGETLTYEVTVTNDGNLTIENVQVVDELEGAVLAEGETAEIGALAPGESATRHFSYTVTQADVLAGRVSNVATATGTSPDPEKPEAPVEPGAAEDPVETPHASLFASKVASDPANGQTFKLGEQISYTIEVVNNGNLAITGITVKDDLTGESWTIETLAAGEKAAFTTSYTVTEADVAAGKVTNVVTAAGTDPEGNPVGTEATATVSVEPAAPAPEPEQPAKPEPPEPTQPAVPEPAKPAEPKSAIAKTDDVTDLGLPARLVDLGLAAVAAGLVCLIAMPRRRND